ncbi:MAG: FHA domain-containing protein [Clostridia bacterium]|nr:FHA domain-containing protein [Clostridia bacterium]
MPNTDPNPSRKQAILLLIAVLLPILFIIIVAGLLLGSPLVSLLLILALVVGIGALKRSKPALFQAFQKEAPRERNIPSSRSDTPPVHLDAQRTYVTLVGLNASNQYSISVNLSPFVIGQSERCNFQIHDEYVSGRHLTIDYDAQEKLCYVTDSSRNGTWLNNERLPKGERRVMRQGDSLQIAGIAFNVEYAHY